MGIALDAGRGKIYWTDAGSNKIQRANLDGSQIENLVSIGLHSPEGLALDAAAGKIYWSDFGIDKIQRANLDGSNVEDIVATGLSSPGGLALDAAAGKIYWSDFGTDKIQRANLDGSQRRRPRYHWIGNCEGAGHWILPRANSTGRIRAPTKFNGPTSTDQTLKNLLTSAAGTPLGLAVISPVASLSPSPSAVTFSRDGSWRSFTVQASEPIIVVANPSGIPARMLATESSGSFRECPAQGEESITRYHGQDIYLAACATGEATVELRRAADQAVLRTYTFRIGAKLRMYWTNAGSWDRIQRADIDGSNVEDLVSTGLVDPVDVALDLAEGKMYWTDHGTDKIQRANLDGSQVEDLVTTGLSRPRGIALDLAAGKMYWIDQGTDKIQRANLDGSQVEDLVAGLGEPRGIALDLDAGKIYWTDNGTDSIQSADLDGSNIQTLVTGLVGPTSIALE